MPCLSGKFLYRHISLSIHVMRTEPSRARRRRLQYPDVPCLDVGTLHKPSRL